MSDAGARARGYGGEMGKRLLLVSTSQTYGTGYLDHCASEMADLLQGVERVLFFPFALHDRDAYAAKARKRFGEMGLW